MYPIVYNIAANKTCPLLLLDSLCSLHDPSKQKYKSHAYKPFRCVLHNMILHLLNVQVNI